MAKIQLKPSFSIITAATSTIIKQKKNNYTHLSPTKSKLNQKVKRKMNKQIIIFINKYLVKSNETSKSPLQPLNSENSSTTTTTTTKKPKSSLKQQLCVTDV
jgi:phosphoketolase